MREQAPVSTDRAATGWPRQAAKCLRAILHLCRLKLEGRRPLLRLQVMDSSVQMHTLRQHLPAFVRAPALTDYKKTTCSHSIRSHQIARGGRSLLHPGNDCPGPASQRLIQARFTSNVGVPETLPFFNKWHGPSGSTLVPRSYFLSLAAERPSKRTLAAYG
jgi:hypothetical protein